MTSIPWQTALIISSMVTREVLGDKLDIYDVPVYIGIWPVADTTGRKATTVTVVAKEADIHFAVDAVANTIGPYSARLIQDVEYVFPLHPLAHTLCMVGAESASTNVYLKWIIG